MTEEELTEVAEEFLFILDANPGQRLVVSRDVIRSVYLRGFRDGRAKVDEV